MPRLNSSPSADGSIEKRKIPYSQIIAVGIIQFLLSLIIQCYGILLMQFIRKDFYNVETGLWTVITFATVSKITSSWTKSYCKYLNIIRSKVHKRNIIICTILLFSELGLISFVTTPLSHVVLYGVFGGLLSAIIQVHLKFFTDEIFKNQPQLFETSDQIMKALTLILMPHFILFLSDLYTTSRAQLIISGLILNIIPVCLLIKKEKNQKALLCKFQTLERLSIETMDLNPKPPITETSSSSSSSSDEDEDVNEVKTEVVQIEPSDFQVYFPSVSILPDIPEENETEEDDDINEISDKRLSKISAILQELNENNKPMNLSVNNLYQPDETIEIEEMNDNVPEVIDRSNPKKSQCFSINSDLIYKLELKRKRMKTFFKEHFIRSIPRTLSKPYFYPAVISSSITTILSAIILAIAPYMMFKKNSNSNNSDPVEDSTFILVIIGFSWIFFLAAYPLFSKLSSLKVRILFLIGLSISGLSLYIAKDNLSNRSGNDFILFSATFGLGHGIVTYTENIAYEDFFEKESWKKLQGPLEISTGHFVILIYLVIYFSNLDINVLLTYAYWLYCFNVLLWIIAYISKQIVVYIRKTRRYNRERYPDFNF